MGLRENLLMLCDVRSVISLHFLAVKDIVVTLKLWLCFSIRLGRRFTFFFFFWFLHGWGQRKYLLEV